MPTGYTAAIHEGKPFTFRQFALGCARAFGALVEMRDEPWDAPIKVKPYEPSEYHTKTLAAAKARLDEIHGMTHVQVQAAADKDYKAQLADYNKDVKRRDDTIARYDAMLEQARAYQPPTAEHEEYAKFMVKQLEDSKKFDTSYAPERPKKISTSKWLDAQLKKVRWEIDYHSKELLKDENRHSDRSGWVKAMLESLPAE